MLRNALAPEAIEIPRQLKAVIEEHLPGDFSSWEDQRSRWVGDVKTIDATQPDPRSGSAAVRIHCAFERGEEMFGYVDREKDEQALLQLERALQDAEAAVEGLSVWTRMELGRASFKEMSGVVGVPATELLKAVANSLRTGMVSTRRMVAEKGTERSKENRRSAAVIAECREIYSARTGNTAPDWVREADHLAPEPNKIVQFVKAVFAILGIRMRVDNAFRTWRKLKQVQDSLGQPRREEAASRSEKSL